MLTEFKLIINFWVTPLCSNVFLIILLLEIHLLYAGL